MIRVMHDIISALPWEIICWDKLKNVVITIYVWLDVSWEFFLTWSIAFFKMAHCTSYKGLLILEIFCYTNVDLCIIRFLKNVYTKLAPYFWVDIWHLDSKKLSGLTCSQALRRLKLYFLHLCTKSSSSLISTSVNAL